MISILIFNLAVDSEKIDYGRDFIFTVSEWFSTCSFVSIGMSLQLAKGDGRELMILTGIYLIIQITDIFSTFAYAYISYTYFWTRTNREREYSVQKNAKILSLFEKLYSLVNLCMERTPC